MARYRPRSRQPDRPNASATLVRTPSGGELDAADAVLAAELGPGVRVIKQDRGVFDTMPLSLLTTQTLAASASWPEPTCPPGGSGPTSWWRPPQDPVSPRTRGSAGSCASAACG